MLKKPLVSIVTVVYNGQKHLEETILSVINQTYDNVEYIIIDGGSSDGTLDIIRKYEHAIDYWVSEKDKGIYDAMNKGIRLSNGEIIGLINADDYYLETTVESVVEGFKSSKSDVVFGNKLALNEELDIQKVVSVTEPTSLKDLAVHVVHPTVFVSKKVYDQNLFETMYRIAADYDFLLSIYDKGYKFHKIDHVLAVMRMGGISDKLNFDAVKIKAKRISLFSSLQYFKYILIRRFSMLFFSKFSSRGVRLNIFLKRGWKTN